MDPPRPTLRLEMDLGDGAGVAFVRIGDVERRRLIAGDMYVVEIRPLARKS